MTGIRELTNAELDIVGGGDINIGYNAFAIGTINNTNNGINNGVMGVNTGVNVGFVNIEVDSHHHHHHS